MARIQSRSIDLGDVAESPRSEAVPSRSPAYQAFLILRIAFVVAPIVAGFDKFFGLLVNWDQYLAPIVTRIIPVAPHTFMMAAGVIEIVAGLLVAFWPAIFAYVVSAWLVGIIVNLSSSPVITTSHCATSVSLSGPSRWGDSPDCSATPETGRHGRRFPRRRTR